jgi:hypothetical protein
MRLSMKEKKPITRDFAARYRAAKSKAEKSGILTEFTTLTGFNRKYAIGTPHTGKHRSPRTGAPLPHHRGSPGAIDSNKPFNGGGNGRNGALRDGLPPNPVPC